VKRQKRLGVIGTLVWDVIYGRVPGYGDHPVEEWGGIAYSLGALDAALADDWEIVPLIRVGSDLITRAREFVNSLGKISRDHPLIEVPWPNNRVVLEYQSSERRSEVLTGGIPPWNWLGLKPLIAGLDALYINMISGFEFDLHVAQLLRQHFRGPIYCDLHSLFLALEPSGLRTPQPLPDAIEWCRCVDFAQLNEDEMNLLAVDPLEFASRALANGVRCMVVTLGARGIVYFAASDFRDISSLRPSHPLGLADGPVRTALIPATRTRQNSAGDPTGCGDVWGATYFARLLAGDNFADAMQSAMVASARNVEYRGATGLAGYLRGGLATT
jgi:sugar/nucleoside kinase (ribokinase family)